MAMYFAVIGGIIGFLLIEKYQHKVGGWGNAYGIYVIVVVVISIGVKYLFL